MKNYTITVNGNVYEVTVEEGFAGGNADASAKMATAPAAKAPVAPSAVKAPVAAASPVSAGTQGSIIVTAPMPGKILGIKANVGQAVKRGEVLVILEAMKMENEIVAPEDGTVASINVAVGESIEAGKTLATLN